MVIEEKFKKDFESLIKNKDLKIISASENLMFIRHYSVSSKLIPIGKLDYQFTFSSGRRLQFIKTPYSHSGGSIVTFDPTSGILFSSDLLGSLGTEWGLFLSLRPDCMDCVNLSKCPQGRKNCPIRDQKIMRYVFERLASLENVGIDGIIDDSYEFNFSNIKRRFN